MTAEQISRWIDLYLYRLGNAMRARDWDGIERWAQKLRIFRELRTNTRARHATEERRLPTPPARAFKLFGAGKED